MKMSIERGKKFIFDPFPPQHRHMAFLPLLKEKAYESHMRIDGCKTEKLDSNADQIRLEVKKIYHYSGWQGYYVSNSINDLFPPKFH